MSKFEIKWIDDGRAPKCAPDPSYPKGKDVDLSFGHEPSCKTDLPYPARRCGIYIIECGECGQRIGLTTAGRRDDARSVKLACKRKEPLQ